MTVQRTTEAIPTVRTRTTHMRVGSMWVQLTERGWWIGDMGYATSLEKVGNLIELLEAVEDEIATGNRVY